MFQKVNDITVKKMDTGGGSAEVLRGSEIFDTPFFTCFISAKRRSGKTNLIFNILTRIASNNKKQRSHIILICPTVNKDKTYAAIMDYFEKRNYSIAAYDSMIDDETGNNILIELMETLKDIKDDRDNYIVVIDDMSYEMKNPALATFLKNGRHYRIRTILSSQYYNDLAKNIRAQIEYFILFGGVSNDKLEEIHMNADISIPYEEFKEAYDNATNQKYNFLFVDKNRDELRHNFNSLWK